MMKVERIEAELVLKFRNGSVQVPITQLQSYELKESNCSFPVCERVLIEKGFLERQNKRLRYLLALEQILLTCWGHIGCKYYTKVTDLCALLEVVEANLV
ncbi:hypothetical protein J6590_049679 [Homalodisca vitripennis]|nr:hypothetical protein J6590_049679 [Homalodisca vitripennis]